MQLPNFPIVKNGYNVAIDFSATYRYPNGVVMTVADTGRNGITFTGTEGRIFVNRERLPASPSTTLPTVRCRESRSRCTISTIWTGRRAARNSIRSSITWETSSTASDRDAVRSPTWKVSTAARPPATWEISRCGSAGGSGGTRKQKYFSTIPQPIRTFAALSAPALKLAEAHASRLRFGYDYVTASFHLARG